MESETKVCQNCKNSFVIEPEDFLFYEKIKVPPPTFCPECRQQRRYAWRNERTLYRRNCDLCQKNIVTVYAPNSSHTVYCPTCWWSDKWNPAEYGQDFDFSRPFFEQFYELQLKVPRISLMIVNCVNSDYVNHSVNSKDCYMSFVAWESEGLLYSSSIIKGKNCVDCYRTEEGSNEQLYECLFCYGSYNNQYCFQVHNSFGCFYSFDLRNCSDCFLSYNLRGKSYCFMNQQLSREDYFNKIKEYNLGSHKVREELYQQWLTLITEKAIHRPFVIEQSNACTGNLIYNSKNALNTFESNKLEDVKYCSVGVEGKDAMDCYHFGTGNSELTYEGHAIAGGYQVLFSHLCYNNSFIQYSDTCYNSQNLFGCISVTKGEYMILNKKYTKEEYELLIEKIISYMKETKEYGEYFPSKYSPFSYNETQGQVYMPLSRESALQKRFKWQDTMPGTFGKETIDFKDIPDNISDISDSIVNEILKCEVSGRNFNIVFQELEFYRKNNIPIPRIHPDERYLRRVQLRPERSLYARMTEDGIETFSAYSPNRKERIVSEEYYKKHIL